MWGGAVAAGVDLGLDDFVQRCDDAGKVRTIAGDGGEGGAAVVVDVALEDAVEVHGHAVEDVGEALRDKADVCSLAPDKEKEGGIQEVTARGIRGAPCRVVRDPDVRFAA